MKICGVLLLLGLLFFSSCASEKQRFTAQRLGYFDSFVVFTGYAHSEEEFSHYAHILFERLDYLHKLYDIFNPHEGMNNLYTVNQQAGEAPVQVNSELLALLLAGIEAYHMTHGTVNIALGAVLQIWHEHRQQGLHNPEHAAIPPMEALSHAATLTNIQDILINIEEGTVFLQTAGMSLDVGSIAKGYTATLAMQAVTNAGMEAALLNIGGHILAHGTPPNKNGWEVSIAHQNETLMFTDATLSVSGASERFYTAAGQRLGHIINPATLMPANIHTQVAVLHPCSWTADILSTALFILPKKEGQQLAHAYGATVFYYAE
jgi:thiamine biosynthesis lipoprotein